jgi:hypothetical protein
MVDNVNGTPAAAAAFASATSPCGQSSPLNAVGAMTTGRFERRPNSVTESSGIVSPTSVRGCHAIRSNTSRLRLSDTSSSAPPSRYSQHERGSRRCAIRLRSSIVIARRRSRPE